MDMIFLCYSRIRHTIVLEDPIDDPDMLAEHIPEASPEPAEDEVPFSFSR